MRPDTTRKGLPLGGPGAINAFRKKMEIRTAEAGPGKDDEGKPAAEKGEEVPVTQTPSNDGGRRRRTTRKSKKATRRRRTTRRR
jgi:hypothetical protein